MNIIATDMKLSWAITEWKTHLKVHLTISCNMKTISLFLWDVPTSQ